MENNINKIIRRNRQIHNHSGIFLYFFSVIEQRNKKISKNIECLDNVNKKLDSIQIKT